MSGCRHTRRQTPGPLRRKVCRTLVSDRSAAPGRRPPPTSRRWRRRAIKPGIRVGYVIASPCRARAAGRPRAGVPGRGWCRPRHAAGQLGTRRHDDDRDRRVRASRVRRGRPGSAARRPGPRPDPGPAGIAAGPAAAPPPGGPPDRLRRAAGRRAGAVAGRSGPLARRRGRLRRGPVRRELAGRHLGLADRPALAAGPPGPAAGRTPAGGGAGAAADGPRPGGPAGRAGADRAPAGLAAPDGQRGRPDHGVLPGSVL